MKDLEKIIRENIEEFTSDEPRDGHFERFENRIKFSKTTKGVNYWFRAAAVFAIIFLSALYAYEKFQPAKEQISQNNNKILALGDLSPEYAEVEFFFVSQVESGMDKIEQLSLFENPQEKQMLLEELANMDSVYTNLQKELHANPKDQRVVEAMIQYYRTKVNIMNNIISKFEQLKTRKNESTEI